MLPRAATSTSAAAAAQARQRLPGHQGLVPPGATLVGPAPTSTALPLDVTLKPRDPAALAAEEQRVSAATPERRCYRALRELLASPYLGGVRRLDLGLNRLGDEGARLLARARLAGSRSITRRVRS